MRERGDASVREGKRGSLRLRGAWGHVERERKRVRARGNSVRGGMKILTFEGYRREEEV